MTGKEQYLDYRSQLKDLSDSDIEELKGLLADYLPSKFTELSTRKVNKRVKEIFKHYRPLPAEESAEISKMQKQQKEELAFQNPNLNDEERVEDAGLDQDANLADRMLDMNANTIVDRIKTRAAG
jgi:glutamyl/glutaminyl-tRNA synthetase